MNNQWVILAVVLLLGGLWWWRSRPDLDSARARQLVGDGATLLDVRTPGEFRSGHVEGALNIPVQQLAQRISEVPKDAPVVVYCASGARSASAVGQLRKAGYDAHNLGGMANW